MDAPPDNQGSVNARRQTQTASVRFFLTESELKEAAIARKSLWRTNRIYRVAVRVVCGFGACFCVVAPSWEGNSWPLLVKTEPVTAIGLFGFAVLWLYVALGAPWVEVLDTRLNRLDLEREITIAPGQVTVVMGAETWKKKWGEFACYYETSGLYVLQTRWPQFWTIPKRAFEPGIERVFQEILESNLTRKSTTA